MATSSPTSPAKLASAPGLASQPATDDLLAELAGKEIDRLIAEEGVAAIPATAPAEDPQLAGELDALFAELVKDDPPPPVAKPPTPDTPPAPADDPTEQMLDALFSELTKPLPGAAATAAAVPSPPPQPTSSPPPASPSSTQPAPSPPTEPPSDPALDSALDALFDELTKPLPGADPPAPSPPPKTPNAPTTDPQPEARDEFTIVRDGKWRSKEETGLGGTIVPEAATTDAPDPTPAVQPPSAAEPESEAEPEPSQPAEAIDPPPSAPTDAETPATQADESSDAPADPIPAATLPDDTPPPPEPPSSLAPPPAAPAEVPVPTPVPSVPLVVATGKTLTPARPAVAYKGPPFVEAPDLWEPSVNVLDSLPDVQTSRLRWLTVALEAAHRPFSFLSPDVRDLLGKVAIVTLFNAAAVLLYVYFVRGG